MSQDPGLYARSFGDVYDDWYSDLDDPALLVAAFAKRLPAGATIVELGSGTGRLAVPLSDAGFDVIALDISDAMLRSAPEPLPSLAADIANVALANNCADAVLIAYNTLFNLDDLRAQQRCLDETARILRSGGLLAIEAFVLPTDEHDRPTDFGASVRDHPTHVDAKLVILTGPGSSGGAADVIVGSHVELLPDATVCRPWQLAYQSPSALDAAALRSHLRLTGRFEDWTGSPFDSDSTRHVSWYQVF